MRNGLKFWLNFLCLVFVAHSHIVHEPTCWFLRRVDFLVIPLFSMMAGVSWGSFLKKTKGCGVWYGVKMFLYPYLFWLGVYFMLNYVVVDMFVRHGEWGVSLSDVVFFLLTGHCGIQLWFLITLVYAMLIFTGLFKMLGNTVMLRVAIAVLLVLSLILPDMDFVTSSADQFRYVEYYRVWFSWLFPGFCITPPVQSLIREGKTFQLQSVIETSYKDGMITLEKYLENLYNQGRISDESTRMFRPDYQVTQRF